MELPSLPAPLIEFLPYLASQKNVATALAPYKEYEGRLRQVFAQHPEDPVLKDHHVNTVPLFQGHESAAKTRARQLGSENDTEKEKYLLGLPDADRRADGSPAVVGSLKEFRSNFNVFSESSLVDLDWTNVVAAGSSVVTSLLPVGPPHNESKRALRTHYHEKLAPASDVDLFLWGLDEKQAIEKIKQIEGRIRDSILGETTTIRTKHAITIASRYPTRHVQIVLRLYKSVSEILTGFDVDCSCVAYDGEQVWAAPRAIAAFITQVNTIDLSRRSPSYENRLSKYARRGFEVHWPVLERSRIDPTIFERSFGRVLGLARLLVFEKLPGPHDRESYMDRRRAERGRPALNYSFCRHLIGNKKDSQPEDVAEWFEQDEISNYHTFTVPYGPKYSAKRIERLLFTKDLLLNAEWNRSKDRETELHRHPAFFGSVNDIIHDCCGFCPEAKSEKDKEIAAEESKTFVSGEIGFLKDDPGRQEIGSFHPITDTDWTEMAYVGNTERLCQAIIDGDVEHIEDWCKQEGVDVNRRDYTGRTPLQLAAQSSTPEVVKVLLQHGARLVSRMADGFTALHLAVRRGNFEIVQALLEKSEANEAEEAEKEDSRKRIKSKDEKDPPDFGKDDAAKKDGTDNVDPEDENDEDADDEDEDDEDLLDDSASGSSDPVTEGSFVKISRSTDKDLADADNDEGPDFYDVNILAWDSPVSPLHLAILRGRLDIVDMLVSNFGADVLLPVKLANPFDRSPRAAIMTLVLALSLPIPDALKMTGQLLALGASSTQTDMNSVSALHYVASGARVKVFDSLLKFDAPAARKAVNHLIVSGSYWSVDVTNPLISAIYRRASAMAEKLLKSGAEPIISLDKFASAYHRAFRYKSQEAEAVKKEFELHTDQPIVLAVRAEMPGLVKKLIEFGADANTLPTAGWYMVHTPTAWRGACESLLDLVQEKIKKLEHFDQKKIADDEPAVLENDAHYLKGIADRSYRYWYAMNDLSQARALNRQQTKWHEESLKQGAVKGMEEQRAFVKSVLGEFKDVEKLLVKKGAKTFAELYPDKVEKTKGKSDAKKCSHEPYKISPSIKVPASSSKQTDSYFELFQAAWEGDAAKVKKLALGTTDQKPLGIAVRDACGFTPYSLAIVQGHLELAKSILDIVGMQYQPADQEKAKRYRLRLQADSDGYDSDYDSDYDGGDPDQVKIVAQIFDSQYTSEDVGQLADSVRSRVKPREVLLWTAEFWRAIDSGAAIETRLQATNKSLKTDSYHGDNSKTSLHHFYKLMADQTKSTRCSLFDLAIAKNDMQLLKYLIGAHHELVKTEKVWDKPDADDEALGLFARRNLNLELALKLGRNDLTGYMIAAEGAFVPVEKLVERSGVLVARKTKYYRGLTVHGKKRQDWADESRGVYQTRFREGDPPLLAAAFSGNVDSVEYFLSDAPLRRLGEFASANKDNELIQALAESEGGIRASFTTWLETRSHLAMHMAVLSPPREEGGNAVLEHLLRVMPENLNAKCITGETPLQIAFQHRRLYDAKLLLAAGANQASRNKIGENLVHSILDAHATNPDLLTAALALIDQAQIPGMLLERARHPTSGLLTPLASWLRSGKVSEKTAVAVFQIIQSHSHGADLEMMDGPGDYPLHYLVRTHNHVLTLAVIDANPALLYKENATGMTPVDVAENQFLRDLMDHPPSVTDHPRSIDSSFVNSKPGDFLPENILDLDGRGERNFAVKNRRLIQAAAYEHPGHRQLVSLKAANEVAKRLAQEQKARTERQEKIEERRRAGQGQKAEETDEVSSHRIEAQRFRRWDLERFQREVLKRRSVGSSLSVDSASVDDEDYSYDEEDSDDY